jgi:hypothetical protein
MAKDGMIFLRDTPEDRLRAEERTGDELTDYIWGILLGFLQVLQKRNGNVDYMTFNDSIQEVRELIRQRGGTLQ